MTVHEEVNEQLDGDRRLYPIVTMDILLGLMGSATRAYLDGDDKRLRSSLIKIISVCHLWLEDKSLSRKTRASNWNAYQGDKRNVIQRDLRNDRADRYS